MASRPDPGFLIPDRATVTAPTSDWPVYTNCYNCAYRNWSAAPPGYVCPSNGKDFPPRRECPQHPDHGQEQGRCYMCNQVPPQNWPCPNGCTDPADHNAGHRYTACTVRPPRRPPPAPDDRCVDGCETIDAALHRANPGLRFDLADSALIYCYHCDHETPLDD